MSRTTTLLIVVLVVVLGILLLALYLVERDLIITPTVQTRCITLEPDSTFSFMTVRSTDIIDAIFIYADAPSVIFINFIPLKTCGTRRKTSCDKRGCSIDINNNTSSILYEVPVSCEAPSAIIPCAGSRQLAAYEMQLRSTTVVRVKVIVQLLQTSSA